MSQPHVVMVAGPNGAGKTSTAMILLPNFLQINEFVNADEIAHGLSPFNQSSMAIEAGRLMLKRINALIENHKHFAFETTGASNVHLRTLKRCRELGYQISLVFLYLPSPAFAIERVKLRVSQGGHDISEADIIRRYYRGIKMFFSHYVDLADTAEIYDNSMGDPNLVAKKYATNSDWSVFQPKIWQNILEMNNEQ